MGRCAAPERRRMEDVIAMINLILAVAALATLIAAGGVSLGVFLAEHMSKKSRRKRKCF